MSNEITLRVSGDHFLGDPAFQVLVDGKQVGATYATQAVHSQGQWQDVVLTGDFDPTKAHDVQVRFANDKNDGGLGVGEGHDRNLYVDSMKIGQQLYQGESASNTAALGYERVEPSAAVMLGTGTLTFHTGAGGAAVQQTGATGAPIATTQPSTTPTNSGATANSNPSSTAKYFASDSLWNTPIGDRPVLSPNSARIAGLLDASGFGFQLNNNNWAVNIAYADANTPRYTVTDPQGYWKMDGVPLPASANGTKDSDSHLVIIDQSQNKVWDFMGAGNLYQSHQAAAFGVYDLNGSGWWDPSAGSGGPWVSRSSNSSSLAGTITPEELKAGHIDHAIAVAADVSLLGHTPALPAKTTDGTVAGGVPIGSHLQLDPNLDINSLLLGPEAKVIAEALQQYGAYVVDRTNGFAVYMQSKQNLPSDPYTGMNFAGLDSRLHDHWQVLAPEAPDSYDSVINHPNVHR